MMSKWDRKEKKERETGGTGERDRQRDKHR
jgi:hypothetical protein